MDKEQKKQESKLLVQFLANQTMASIEEIAKMYGVDKKKIISRFLWAFADKL